MRIALLVWLACWPVQMQHCKLILIHSHTHTHTHTYVFMRQTNKQTSKQNTAAHTKLLTSDQFQIEMMKMLRELNVDNNCVGWYQSSHLGSYHAQTLIDTQIAYQNDLGENSVVIVYDAVSTRSGSLGLKAYRLTSNFVKAKEARRNEFVAVDDMFEEIPVVIKNGGLVRGLLYDLGEEEGGKFDFGAERLKMESSGFLEKSLQNITHYVEDLNAEHSSMSKYSRSLMRMEGGRWDKNTREKTEKKTVDKHSKWVGNEEAPTRLNALIYNKQIGTFCDNVDRFADTQMEKLFLTGAAQKGN